MEPYEGKRSMLHFIEDQVEWTEEKYSLTSFREQARFKLPTLIHITGGYFGKDNNDTFSSDEVLVLYEWKLQERVLAKKDKVSISIPLDFKHKLEVLEPGKPRRVMHLSQIVQKYKPPVQVRFGPGTKVSFTLGKEEIKPEAFGTFMLMSSHFLEYATASATVKGTISTEKLVCLPIYRRLRFVVATRLHGVPMEQHSHYFNSFRDHIETPHTLGILEYTELLDTMEEYDYIREIPRGPWGKSRDDHVPTENNGQYTLLKTEDHLTNYEPVETNHRTKEKGNSPVPGPGKYPPINRKSSARTKLPIVLPSQLRRDVVGPTNPTGPIHGGNGRPVAPIFPINPSNSKPSKTDPTKPVGSQAPPLFPRSSVRPKVRPPVSPRPLSPISKNPVSPLQPGAGQHAVTGSSVTNSTPNLSQTTQSSPVSVSPMPSHEEGKRSIVDSTTALFPSVKSSQNKESVLPPPLVIHTLGDVPADLTVLSVDQVCHCLALLDLGEFVPRFRRAMVDGRVLNGCSEEDWMQEFSMGHFSARKLVMFANDGWRPKE